MNQRRKFLEVMGPLMQAIADVAPTASEEDLLAIGMQIAEAAPAITTCLNGSEQFKAPTQLELPV